jgi:succinate-semialdehyde dehydrogenase/glutarate-semialdehyde dehydrogenase
VYVQSGVYDAFADKLAEKVAALKVGDGAMEGTTQGPLISRAALEKVARHVADAKAKGAVVVCGGEEVGDSGGAFFYAPTVMTNVGDDAIFAEEETFGPVAPLYRFDDEAEVVRRANAVSQGLAAFFCTRDLGRAMRVSEALEAGIVGVNEGIISTEVAPFGGVKESGFGREGSRHGLDEYMEIKYTLFGYPPA